ncbi:MAG TPA: adenosine deaminase [Candidatus Acidoferrales bacterium]|nr:adenosine deaminase [Candidatus Acidoferrales bacterium]
MIAAQPEFASSLARLPKAELHLHLEGCLTPALLVQLAARHGEQLDLEKVVERYNMTTFAEFLDLFKWATSYLRQPQDYAVLVAQVVSDLSEQHCAYAEITLSVGVMLLRNQNVEANFAAILNAVQKVQNGLSANALRLNWIFDAVRQFGPDKAMDVAKLAVQLKSAGVVAFGLGGDENSLPAADFRRVYDYVASTGLHRLAHAGEMAGPQAISDAIEILGAERIGHGISAIQDGQVMDLLVERQIPLEICPASNLCTGALAKLLGTKQARLEDHPLPKFIARGVPVTLSTDDPAMFRTSLNETYATAISQLALTPARLVSIAEASFQHAFLPATEKETLLERFHAQAKTLNLL